MNDRYTLPYNRNMNRRPTKALLQKYLSKTCTPEEGARIEQWYLDMGKQLPEPDADVDYVGVEQAIWTGIQAHMESKARPKLRWMWAAAAVLLIALGSLFYMQQGADIQPGYIQAKVLTRAGKMRPAGLETAASNLDLSKPQAVQDVSALITPQGGEYTVTLPDGSLVRLNADSRLDIAEDFMEGDDRVVYLSGEAYFEVEPMPDKPFRVQAGTASIEVLGTHFNVESYPENQHVKATLIEGRIAIAKADQQRILAPGEQALILDGSPEILIDKGVNTEVELAWTQGYFAFNDDRIDVLLQDIARWYQIEVRYPDGVPNKRLTGKIGKSSQIDEVLQMLEYAGISYEMQDRTLRILNPH